MSKRIFAGLPIIQQGGVFIAVSVLLLTLSAGTLFAKGPGNKLPEGCAEGNVAKWDTTAETWICAEDIDTTSDVSGLEWLINNNAENILTNTNDISVLKWKVNNNTYDILTNSTDVLKNAQTVADLKDSVLGLKKRLSLYDHPDCATGVRYVDDLNGTIYDCNTQLVWLKDANCLDLLGTDPDGKASWDDAVAAASALADGICGLTDGSSAGDWRLPTAAEFCSAWGGEYLLCPGTAASDSMIDTAIGPQPPAPGYNYHYYVANTAGTRSWTEGDAFSGVQPGTYWSGTQTEPYAAWRVLISYGSVTFAPTSDLHYVWPVREVFVSSGPPVSVPGGQAGCEAGEVTGCYSGDPGTLNVGECTAGYRICTAEGSWTECRDEVTPQDEYPDYCGDGMDNNCDGKVDFENVECRIDADGDGYYANDPDLSLRDCYDSNPDAHPGQNAYFAVHRGDGSFDYNCSGTVDLNIAAYENGCYCASGGFFSYCTRRETPVQAGQCGQTVQVIDCTNAGTICANGCITEPAETLSILCR